MSEIQAKDLTDEQVKEMVFNLSRDMLYIKESISQLPLMQDQINGLNNRKTNGVFSVKLDERVSILETAITKLTTEEKD